MLPGIAGMMLGAVSAEAGPVVTERGYSETGTGVSVGTAAADRRVIVAVHWRAGGTNRTLDGINIGGVEGVIHAQRSHTGGSSSVGVALCSRLVTSGTTVDINPTYSGAVTDEGLGVWTMTGEENSSPTSTDTDESAGSTGSISVDLVVEEGGAVFAAHSLSTNAQTDTTAWTGVDENYDTSASADTPNGFSGGYRRGLTADASYTITANPGTTINAGNDLVAISWR